MNLSLLAFEFDSELSILGDGAFSRCWRLNSLFITASLHQLTGLSMAVSGIRNITLDEDSPFFRVCDDFVVDFPETCLVWYFGQRKEVTMSSDIVSI
jgi:hypothetical protein